MTIKKKNVIPTEAITRSTAQMSEVTGNLYETVLVISKRANQIAREQQEELKAKLEGITPVADDLNERQENKELIELSSYYERLPKPTLVATYEYDNGEIYYELKNKEKEEA